jgi:predicted nucleic-acid-binding protein
VRREEIYVETSVWSFVFADDEPARKAATEQFFNVAREAKLFIAELAIYAVPEIATPEEYVGGI